MDDRLFRSRTDRMIAGVAGGLAERYDLDPALVRIGWALLILGTGGLFFLLYIVMAIVVPEEPLEWTTPPVATGTATGTASPAPGAAPDAAIGSAPEGGSEVPGSVAGASLPGATQPGAAPAMSPREARRAARGARRASNAPMIFGAVLVIVGILALAGQVVPGLDFDLIWPIGLIVLGGALVFGATNRRSS